ncbi:MAG: lytic murein transglycosylase [Sandaracinobacteroides sp.]
MMRFLLVAAALLIASPVGADETPPADGFPIWLANYKTAAEGRGLKPEWLEAALSDTAYNGRVVELDRNQPDDSGKRNVFADYLARQLNQQRIDDGVVRAIENRDVLQRISAQSGVPPEIIVAIWGMETSYGRVMGSFDLPSAIASLAYDGRREALFTRELDALVRMVGEKGVRRDQLTGSWAGAFGQSQFLPSSYLAHAADGDGDGLADIWRSRADSFASIGRYLKDKGWKPGIGWGFRAGVPTGFDRATVANPVQPTECIRPLQRHSRWLTVGEWKASGFIPLNGLWPADDVEMSLVEPDGPGEGAFLTTRNYRAILEYNCSNFYALSVALLGNAVQPAFRSYAGSR